MKYKAEPWRLTWRFLVAFAIVVLIISLLSYSLFFYFDFSTGRLYIIKWDYRQILFVSIILGISVVFYILTMRSFYYEIEDKYFTVRRYSKVIQYSYDNIIFINEDRSEKEKKIIFYTEKTQMVSLLADKENKVYKTLLKKCPNRLSIEEFRRRHPEEKL